MPDRHATSYRTNVAACPGWLAIDSRLSLSQKTRAVSAVMPHTGHSEPGATRAARESWGDRVMNRFWLLCACLGLASLSLYAAPQAAPPAADRGTFVATYCVSCHGGARPAAGIAFDRLDAASVAGHEEVWEKAVSKVRAGDMPPAGARAPEQSVRTAFVASLESSLDQLSAAHPNPGRPAPHRLNRTEYANAVRDLLGVDIDSRDLLPADDAGYGFDNIADVLSISPSLLDRYMSAAGKISRIAVGDPSLRTAIKIYTANRELIQNDRMSEDLPFGTRGGLSVRHYFPVDGEYLIKVRMMRTANDSIIGVNRSNTLELRMDRKHLRTFTVGGEGPISAWAAVANPSLYEQTADDGLEVRLSVKAGAHLVGSAFLTGTGAPEEPMEPRLSTSTYAWAMHREGEASLSSIEVRGPLRADGAPQPDGARIEPAGVRVPARRGGARGRLRAPDSFDAGAPRVPASGDRSGRPNPDGLLSDRPREGQLRVRASSSRCGRFWSTPISCSASSAIRRT